MNLGPHLKVVIVVQARMGATRLPGKPLKEVLGKPLLSYLFDRLKKCQLADEVVLATTDLPKDDCLEALAKKENIVVVRGSEEDVLSRYLLAAEKTEADIIVRITADCPLMDPEIIDQEIAAFKRAHKLDYLSNVIERTYPRGLDIEIFSRAALERAAKNAKSQEEREHVTLYIYRNPALFRLENFSYTRDISAYRWTVDTAEDFELIRHMIEAVYPTHPHFTLDDLVRAYEAHSEWHEINKHIVQKPV